MNASGAPSSRARRIAASIAARLEAEQSTAATTGLRGLSREAVAIVFDRENQGSLPTCQADMHRFRLRMLTTFVRASCVIRKMAVSTLGGSRVPAGSLIVQLLRDPAPLCLLRFEGRVDRLPRQTLRKMECEGGARGERLGKAEFVVAEAGVTARRAGPPIDPAAQVPRCSSLRSNR